MFSLHSNLSNFLLKIMSKKISPQKGKGSFGLNSEDTKLNFNECERFSEDNTAHCNEDNSISVEENHVNSSFPGGNIMYRCSFCPYIARNERSLATHVRWRHVKGKSTSMQSRKKAKSTKRMIFSCKKCTFSATTSSGLLMHTARTGHKSIVTRKKVQNTAQVSSNTEANGTEQHKPSNKSRKFFCSYCPFSAMSQKSISTHIQWRHTHDSKILSKCSKKEATKPTKTKTFACKHCTFSSLSAKGLFVHTNRRHWLTFDHSRTGSNGPLDELSTKSDQGNSCNSSQSPTKIITSIHISKRNSILQKSVVLPDKDKLKKSGKDDEFFLSPEKTIRITKSGRRIAKPIDYVFPKSSSLKSVNSGSIQSEINQFNCSSCSFRTSYRQRLKIHLKEIHPNNSQNNSIILDDADNGVKSTNGSFICDKCSFFSPSQRGIRVHTTKSHPDSENPKEEKEINPGNNVSQNNSTVNSIQLTCSSCSFITASKKRLSNHILLKHPVKLAMSSKKMHSKNFMRQIDPNNSQNSTLILDDADKVNSTTDTFNCVKCSFSSPSQRGIHIHTTRCHPNSTQPSDEANVNPDNNVSQSSVNNFQLTCSSCSFITASKKRLSNHILRKHPGKLLQQSVSSPPGPNQTTCSLCSFSGINRKSLISHICRVHSNHKTVTPLNINNNATSRVLLSENKSFLSSSLKRLLDSSSENGHNRKRLKELQPADLMSHTTNQCGIASRNKFTCSYCFFAAATNKRLTAHILRKHAGNCKPNSTASQGKSTKEMEKRKDETTTNSVIIPDNLEIIDGSVYSCKSCLSQFKSKKRALKHLCPLLKTSSQSKKKSKEIVCSICSSKFKTKIGYCIHYSRAHISTNQKNFSICCQFCKFHTSVFKLSTMEAHVKRVHSTKSDIDWKYFPCEHCDSRFQAFKTLRVHCYLKHAEFYSENPFVFNNKDSKSNRRTKTAHLNHKKILETSNLSSKVAKVVIQRYIPKTKNRSDNKVIKWKLKKNIFCDHASCTFTCFSKSVLNHHVSLKHKKFDKTKTNSKQNLLLTQELTIQNISSSEETKWCSKPDSNDETCKDVDSRKKEVKYSCNHCDFVCFADGDLDLHIKDFHAIRNLSQNTSYIAINSAIEQHDHVPRRHITTAFDKSDNQSIKKGDSISKGVECETSLTVPGPQMKPYHCCFCTYLTVSLDALVYHAQNSHPVQVYRCSHCFTAFETPRQLVHHLKSHSSAMDGASSSSSSLRYRCLDCNQKLTSIDLMPPVIQPESSDCLLDHHHHHDQQSLSPASSTQENENPLPTISMVTSVQPSAYPASSSSFKMEKLGPQFKEEADVRSLLHHEVDIDSDYYTYPNNADFSSMNQKFARRSPSPVDSEGSDDDLRHFCHLCGEEFTHFKDFDSHVRIHLPQIKFQDGLNTDPNFV